MAEGKIVKAQDGGRVDGVSWLFKAIGEDTGGRFDFMVGEVEYLSGPPLHVHDEQDDSFYVLEGVLAVQVGDEVFDVGPGDFATAPPGVPHTFDNVRRDQGPVKTINLMTPGGLHSFFAERAGAGSDAPADEVRALAEKYGMRVVGPTLGEKLGIA
jgi:mannose-6-phosphate isomerase-like protein (cupin superfamily)